MLSCWQQLAAIILSNSRMVLRRLLTHMLFLRSSTSRILRGRPTGALCLADHARQCTANIVFDKNAPAYHRDTEMLSSTRRSRGCTALKRLSSTRKVRHNMIVTSNKKMDLRKRSGFIPPLRDYTRHHLLLRFSAVGNSPVNCGTTS